MAKKKKLSEEEQEKQFMEWKEGDEFSLLLDLKDAKKNCDNNPLNSKYDEQSDDFIGTFEELIDLFMKIPTTFNIKKCKMKPLLQEHLRTIYFGSPVDRDKVFTVDLENLEYPEKCKSYPQECRHLRNCFIQILKVTESLDTLDKSDYELLRKDRIINKFKDFAKKFKLHILKDKSHSLTKKYLYQVLDPLIKLMEVNNKLFIFEFQFQNEKSYNENSFLYNALILEFSKCYQKCQEILFIKSKENKEKEIKEIEAKELRENIKITKDLDFDKIFDNPNIFSVLKKINYENWRNNKIENFFINPLNQSFINLRINLNKLYLLGFNFWKQPLSYNVEFLKNVQELIKNEKKTEILLGDHLSRNQINFLFNFLTRIYYSEVKEKFCNKKNLKKIKTKIIPQLSILKGLINFNEVIEKKKNFIKKHNLEDNYIYKENNEESEKSEMRNTFQKINDENIIEFKKDVIDFALLDANNPNKVITKQDILPKGITYKEEYLNLNNEKIIIPFDDNDYYELENFGRLFIWPNYLPEEKYNEFFELAKEISILNKTVIKDLENYIIVEGLFIDLRECNNNFQLAHESNKIINKLKEKEINEEKNLKRPPYLYNEINSMSEHKLLFCANPLKIYEDNKIKEIYDKILELSKIILNHKSEEWNYLIDNIFELFYEVYDTGE